MGRVGDKEGTRHTQRGMFTARQCSSGLAKLLVVFMVAAGALALLVCHPLALLWFPVSSLLPPAA